VAWTNKESSKGTSMNNEIQRVMEALMLIYGKDLQAATITVLLKDGDTAVRYLTYTLPQKEMEKTDD
jgi:hypothetical protein